MARISPPTPDAAVPTPRLDTCVATLEFGIRTFAPAENTLGAYMFPSVTLTFPVRTLTLPVAVIAVNCDPPMYKLPPMPTPP